MPLADNDMQPGNEAGIGYSTCTFCDQFRNGRSGESRKRVLGINFRREIYEDEHFVVVAALGQIVEGWLLLIPRDHVTCIAALPLSVRASFLDTARKACLAVTNRYSPPILFEHGSTHRPDISGACIDHAHLHIVPAKFDLRDILNFMFTPLPIAGLSQLWSNPPEKNYLYYEDRNSKACVIYPDRPLPCQFFRRLVAQASGCPNQWDWRSNMGLETVKSVTDKLKGMV